MAMKQAVSELELDPKNTVLVSGIGCGPKMPLWVNVSGFQSLHGRTLPVAAGIKLANHKLDVFATSGDGDAYGIGTCHFIHAMRRNIDMVYIVHNNQVYGLTQGQASPTTDKGMHTKSTPFGVIEVPMRPLSQAIVTGATFVARGFAGDIPHLKSLIVEAHKHRGFALIDVLQPCVTFNKINTYKWFQDKVYKVSADHNPSDKMEALKLAEQWDKKIPLGVYYQEEKPTYNDELPQLADKTLREYGVEDVNIAPLMKEYE